MPKIGTISVALKQTDLQLSVSNVHDGICSIEGCKDLATFENRIWIMYQIGSEEIHRRADSAGWIKVCTKHSLEMRDYIEAKRKEMGFR